MNQRRWKFDPFTGEPYFPQLKPRGRPAKSGIVGVSQIKGGKWKAQTTLFGDKKQTYIGLYSTIEEAKAALDDAHNARIPENSTLYNPNYISKLALLELDRMGYYGVKGCTTRQKGLENEPK